MIFILIFIISFNILNINTIYAYEDSKYNISTRLESLELCLNLFLYLNNETKKIVEDVDSNIEVKSILNLYKHLIDYIEMEIKTDPESVEYKKNLYNFIINYKNEFENKSAKISSLSSYKKEFVINKQINNSSMNFLSKSEVIHESLGDAYINNSSQDNTEHFVEQQTNQTSYCNENNSFDIETPNCWGVQEISTFAFHELDGLIVFSFKDAVYCSPIPCVQIEMNNQTFITDKNGYMKLPIGYFESMNGTIKLVAKRSEYYTLRKDIRIMIGTTQDKRFVMSKQLPTGKVRFVLQWGQKPKDLDLHLVGEDFHISYRNNKVAYQKARLDRDDIDSFGPETITLEKIILSNKYDLYVHNYSGVPTIDEQAEVSVYKDNQLDRLITLPRTKKRYVKILEIRNRTIQYVNLAVDRIQGF